MWRWTYVAIGTYVGIGTYMAIGTYGTIGTHGTADKRVGGHMWRRVYGAMDTRGGQTCRRTYAAVAKGVCGWKRMMANP